jgi:hypothetical protein
MMFLVERPTPGRLTDHDNGVARALRHALPFSVQVENDPELRTSYDSVCPCKAVYRLTDNAVSRQLKKLGLFLDVNKGRPNPCVCDCMGRIL